MLTKSQIAALYGKPAQPNGERATVIRQGLDRKLRKVRKSRQALIVDPVTGKLYKANVRSCEYGAFEGNVGSIRRSRKGRVYRLANGSRRYNGITNVEVVSYQA